MTPGPSDSSRAAVSAATRRAVGAGRRRSWRQAAPTSLAVVTKALVVTGCVALSAEHLYLQRTLTLENYVASTEIFALDVLPRLLSGAAGGPGRRIGEEDPPQAMAFRERSGLVPSSRLDIRDVPASGQSRTLWIVDPGIMWVWHWASRLGSGLDLASLARAQTYSDLTSFVLAIGLGWRLAGAHAAALTSLLYAWSLPIADGVLVVSYYPWSIVASLIAGHLALSAMVWRPFLAWWLAYTGFAAAMIWLRGVWLPVVFASLSLALVPTVRRPRLRTLAVLVGLMLIAGSFGTAVARVKSAGVGGDALVPRAQLWHTLYVGLGWYKNFPPIEWRDSYALDVAARAGFAPERSYRAYEDYLRRLFLDEVARAPLTYVMTLGNRMVDYLAAPWNGWGSMRVMRAYGLFGLGLMITAVVVGRRAARRRFLGPLVLYLLAIAAWSFLLPPQLSYTLETLGLVYPLVASAFVCVLATAFQRAPRPTMPASVRSLAEYLVHRAGQLAVPSLIAGAVILGAIAAAPWWWWSSAVREPQAAQPIHFRRVDDGSAPPSEPVFPSTLR